MWTSFLADVLRYEWTGKWSYIHLMRVHMHHVYMHPAPGDCLLCSINPSPAVGSASMLIPLISLSNCAPSPQCTFWFTSPPLNIHPRCPTAAFFGFFHSVTSFPLSLLLLLLLSNWESGFFSHYRHYLFISSPLICCLDVRMAPLSRETDVGSQGWQMEMIPLRFSGRVLMQT